MSIVYNISAPYLPPNHHLLWAKADQQTQQTHPLIYHMLDVANVSLSLWQNALSESSRSFLANHLGLSIDDAGNLIAFWIGLHDLGKASPGFQRKFPPAVQQLQEAGFSFPERYAPKAAPHGWVSAWALQDLLQSETNIEPNIARKISLSLGGHHGAWPTPDKLMPTKLKSYDKGDQTWDEARLALLRGMMSLYNPSTHAQFPSDQDAENALLTLFSGLASVADWIGSFEKYFPFVDEYIPLDQYTLRSAQNAEKALDELGWIGWQARHEKKTFTEMFDLLPYAIQSAVISSVENITLPALLILEAPTGIGKTEAALYIADSWLQDHHRSGLYIAMPTQATSNQMFDRLFTFLSHRYPADQINLHLIHGQAQFRTEGQEPVIQDIQDDNSSTSEGSIAAMSWFLPRKRTLLAPFGVGTVDQALMSVLQTRHFFVRLFGLNNKVVIFDEVHAYDTYMSTLFQRLLGWLRSIGTSVIILTATLPENTRRELISAYTESEILDQTPTKYPRLSKVTDDRVDTIELPSPPDRQLLLEWIDPAPASITDKLRVLLADGGCAAVICNRVDRAQDVYRDIKKERIVEEENLILFHARFPFIWRNEIEKKVLTLFSKDGKRPERAILVATQVVEQSLDLDFDLIISDLAPIDLLIQRAGRLHRHEKNDPFRPSLMKTTRLMIASPPVENQIPDFGRDVFVYEPYILMLTWYLLQEREAILLPTETSALIEAVYGNNYDLEVFDPAFSIALSEAREKMRMELEKDKRIALTRLVPDVQDEELLTHANQGLEEENPAVHQVFRAMTRLIEPGVNLVCLHQKDTGFTFDPSGDDEIIDLDLPPSRDQIHSLLHHSVTVRHRGIVDFFLKANKPQTWSETAWLRYHHLAIFINGICRLEGTKFMLYLNKETGLEVRKEAV